MKRETTLGYATGRKERIAYWLFFLGQNILWGYAGFVETFLTDIGTYQVLFQVSVTEAGQLVLTLNGAELAYTVVGRATGTSQLVGMALVTTTGANSVLTVRNPEGTAEALTITPVAGGTEPVSAHLVITQLQ